MRKVVSFDTRSLWRYFDLQLCRYFVHRKVESKISCIEVNFNYILYIYIYIYIYIQIPSKEEQQFVSSIYNYKHC